jgi:hypothetical protein
MNTSLPSRVQPEPGCEKTARTSTLLLAAIVLCFSSTVTPAATRIWIGAGGDTLWSNAGNWSNGVPVAGDSIVLPRHPLGFAQNTVNDLTNLTIHSIRCEASGGTIAGGAVRLAGDITVGGPFVGANLTISAPLDIVGPASQFLSTNSASFTLSGVVNSPAGAVVTIDGGISFRASPGSDYRAETRLRSGFMPLLFTRLNGPFVVGGGGPTDFATVPLQSGNLFGNFPPLTVLTNGAVFNISTFNSVGSLMVDGGVLRVGNRSPNGELTVNGNALLTGGASLFVSAINDFGPGELSITGTVTIAGCSLAFNPGSGALTKPGVIVRNDDSDPVSGTFTGLPEGSVLTNGLVRYLLSYVGGDGNDISLSPIIEPARFIAATLMNGAPQFTVQGQPGFSYIIEATTNLLSPPALIPWQPIRTNGTLGDGQFQFTDPDNALFPHRFYRALKR